MPASSFLSTNGVSQYPKIPFCVASERSPVVPYISGPRSLPITYNYTADKYVNVSLWVLGRQIVVEYVPLLHVCIL